MLVQALGAQYVPFEALRNASRAVDQVALGVVSRGTGARVRRWVSEHLAYAAGREHEANHALEVNQCILIEGEELFTRAARHPRRLRVGCHVLYRQSPRAGSAWRLTGVSAWRGTLTYGGWPGPGRLALAAGPGGWRTETKAAARLGRAGATGSAVFLFVIKTYRIK